MSNSPSVIDNDLFLETDRPRLQVKIADLESHLMKSSSKVEIKVTHHFSKDVYAREIFIPCGTLLVGKIHKHENLNIMSRGDASVLSIDGALRVKAPYTCVSQPGAKRVIYAHEDTIWTTIHGTSLTDLEAIEEEFIAKNYDEVPLTEKEIKDLKEAKCLG